MTRTAHFLELDEATRRYLLTVRDRNGEGMPGVYVPGSSSLPLVGLIAGLILIVGILYLTLPPLADPLKVSLLQAAVLLPGLWMVIAALRVWFARANASRSYLGHFVYADSQRLWQAAGNSVTVTDLEGLQNVQSQENLNNQEEYQNSTIDVALPSGPYRVIVSDAVRGQQLGNFLAHLIVLRDQAEGRKLTPVAAGHIARGWAEGDPSPQAGDLAGEVSDLPEPQRVGRAPSGLVACVVIIALAVGGVFLLRKINTGLRDNAILDMVTAFRRPEDLRAYLLDPRNTRHRARVEKMLAEYYEPVIAGLQQRGQDPGLTEGLVTVVASIKTAVQPLVSLRVKEQVKVPQEGRFTADEVRAREQDVQKRLVDSLSQIIGPQLIAFVEAPADIAPLIDVVYQFQPTAKAAEGYQVHWTITWRTKPEDRGVEKTLKSPLRWNEDRLPAAVADETRQLLAAMGAAPVEVGRPNIDVLRP